MPLYIARRVFQVIPALIIVAVAVFAILRFVPGDPARVLLGDDASEAQIGALRESLGLNRPVYEQFFGWIGGVLVGDFGDSVFLDQPIGEAILQHAEPTILLALSAQLLALVIAIPAGVIAASRRGRAADAVVSGGALLGISTPSFLVGLLLVLVFGVWLRLLPVAGYTSPFEDFGESVTRMILPAIALACAHIGVIARMTRSSTLDVLPQPFIDTARSKGVGPGRVLLGHALRNAAIPVITVVGQSFGALITGALVVEIVFGIPGIGQLIGNSIARRDYNVIQAVVLVVATVYILINLLVDLSYGLLDPRMRRR